MQIKKMQLSLLDFALSVRLFLLPKVHVPTDQPIQTLAIAARNGGGLTPQPIVPCGACRQVILEIEDRYKQPVRILLYGTEAVYVVRSVKDLLPLQFVSDSMK